MAPSRRLMVLLCFSVIVLASCGSGADDNSATSTTAADSGGATTTTTEAGNEPTTEATTTTTMADSATNEGNIQVVFEDGRSWTFTGSCTYTPDNTGPASALWSIEAEDAADGAGFSAIMAFPFDPAKTTPVLIGTMVDGDDNPYVFIEVEDVSDGSSLILNMGVHDGVFKSVDDPADFTATVTCDL